MIIKLIKRWKLEKQEYREYVKRKNALPHEYQVVLKEIEGYMWNYAGGDGRSMLKLFYGMLELFEAGASEGQDVLALVGNDVGAFCDSMLKEADTWTAKRRETLNRNIHKKLGREERHEQCD